MVVNRYVNLQGEHDFRRSAAILRMVVNRKQWNLGEITVNLRHDRQHCEDWNNGEGGKIEVLTREFSTEKPINEEQHAALRRIADKCPVHLTLEAHPRIDTVVLENPAVEQLS